MMSFKAHVKYLKPIVIGAYIQPTSEKIVFVL